MPRPSTLPVLLRELAQLPPLDKAAAQLPEPNRRVEQVILAESFERVRRATPHALIVLHAEAAKGGWSLAAALHLAWERNAAGVVVPRAVSGPANAALAHRLDVALFIIDDDPVDVALHLAGLVSAPEAARALRHAKFAERLAEQTSVRGVLGVLNHELDPVPVGLLVGDTVAAGRAAAVHGGVDTSQVSVEVHGPGDQPWARLVAAVPAGIPATERQTEALLRLARPSLLAAWAQSRLDAATHGAYEQAAFRLLRGLAEGDDVAEPDSAHNADVMLPAWSSELGWRIEGANRAVWLAPLRLRGAPTAELTHLVRTAWQRGRPNWPLVAEDDGWLSWHNGAAAGDSGDSDDSGDEVTLRRVLASFRSSAAAYGLVIGVGRSHDGVTGLMRSVAEARLAAHVARDHGPGGVQWFDQVGARAALAWLPVAEIAEVAELCLTDLMSARDRAVLVETVLAVLDCGGALSQASRRLGVHRNTVLARITRARQLGLDVDDPAQRLALHVLCYALAGMSDTVDGGEPDQTSSP